MHPLQSKHGVLTTGLPGKTLERSFLGKRCAFSSSQWKGLGEVAAFCLLLMPSESPMRGLWTDKSERQEIGYPADERKAVWLRWIRPMCPEVFGPRDASVFPVDQM